MNAEQTSPSEVKALARPYSCIGCPPVPRDNGGEKKPTDVAKELHEKCVSVTVADMRGQF